MSADASDEFRELLAGVRLRRGCSVPRELAKRLHRGGPVTVVYLPEDARICRIAGSDEREVEVSNIRSADTFGAFGLAVPLLFVWQLRRWYSKQANSKPAEAG